MGTFGEGNGNPLLYSCLENPIDRGAWQATVNGGLKSGTQLGNYTTTTTTGVLYQDEETSGFQNGTNINSKLNTGKHTIYIHSEIKN